MASAQVHDRANRPRVQGWSSRRGLVAGLLVWAVITAALMVNATWRSERIERAAVTEAEARALAGAAALEQYVLRSLDGVTTALELMAIYGRHRETDPLRSEVIGQQVTVMTRQSRFGMMQAGFVDANGVIVWAAADGGAGTDISSRTHIRAILVGGEQGLHVSALRPALFAGNLSLFFTRAVRAEDGRLLGVAVVAVDAEALSRSLASLRLRDGDVAALRHSHDGMLFARSGASAADLATSPSPGVREAMERTPTGMVPIESPIAGRDAFLASFRIPDAPLIVSFSVNPNAELREAALAIRAEWLAHAALAIGFGIALALLATLRRRRDAAQRLHETDDLLGAVPAIIVRGAIDARGRYRREYMSPSVEAVTGWPAAALDTPDKWRAISNPPSDEPWERAYRSLRQSDEFTIENQLRRADGRWMWVRTHGRVFRRHPDGSAEFTSYIVDISHEREMAAQAAATAKLATLGEMATGLAHELNQPIAVMMLAAENAAAELEEGEAPPPARVMQRLNRIGELGERAKVIVDHLRLFGHPSNDEPEPVEIAQAVDGARILTGAALRQAQVSMAVELPADLPRARAQLVRLEQVLVNLIMNARDVLVARQNEAPRRLRLVASAEADQIVIKVADNGRGIAPDVLPRIFEPFVTTKGVGQGTGLGLSICYGIVRGFGGEISAENQAEGAVFTIVLPIWAESDVPALSLQSA